MLYTSEIIDSFKEREIDREDIEESDVQIPL